MPAQALPTSGTSHDGGMPVVGQGRVSDEYSSERGYPRDGNALPFFENILYPGVAIDLFLKSEPYKNWKDAAKSSQSQRKNCINLLGRWTIRQLWDLSLHFYSPKHGRNRPAVERPRIKIMLLIAEGSVQPSRSINFGS
jgi:hypothetical protein